MLLTKLKLNYFGQFHNKELELKPGINIIYGENEAGKSTIHTFIKGMLFGIERLRGRGSASKEDQYARYLPWDYPGAFGGSMELQTGDKEYRLQRSFHANDKSFTVWDKTTGREVKLKEGLISEIIPGLTESIYKNTISIEQLKASTDSELAAQVRNYITNLSIAKSNEVNVLKAVTILTEKRKQLESMIDPNQLKTLQEEIQEGLAKEEQIEKRMKQLLILQEEEKHTRQKMEAIQSQIDSRVSEKLEQFPAILEKYSAYRELIRQEKHLESQRKEQQEKLLHLEAQQNNKKALREDIHKIQELQKQLLRIEIEETEMVSETEVCHSKGRAKQLIWLIIFLFTAVAVAALSKMHPVGFMIAAILLVSGMIGYRIAGNKHNNKQSAIEEKLQLLLKNKTDIQTGLSHTLQEYGVNVPEDLTLKQDEVIRAEYELKRTKDQWKDLESRINELEDNKDAIYDVVMNYMQYFQKEEELTEEAIQRLQNIISQKKQEISEKIFEQNRQHEDQKLAIEKLRWEITLLEGNEKQLLKNQERYKELEQKQQESLVELEAVKLALRSIRELSVDIHDSFGQQLNRAISEIMKEVTKDKYTDIKVDENLDVKVGWNHDYILLDRLSAGTMDQVYFALRLAVADILLGKEEMPLLLDDSFALYDDNRIKAVINKLMQREQVIIFTCHKREQEILKEMGIPFQFLSIHL